jgi:hypothetical protein
VSTTGQNLDRQIAELRSEFPTGLADLQQDETVE